MSSTAFPGDLSLYPPSHKNRIVSPAIQLKWLFTNSMLRATSSKMNP
jgi:hypothetical protein